MFKLSAAIFVVLACSLVEAKPGVLLNAVPAGVVTATSSQYVARNFNGIAHAPIVAPVAPVARIVAPVAPVAAPVVAPVAAARLVAPVAPAAYAVPHAAAYTVPAAYAHPAVYPHPAAYTAFV